MDFKKLEAFVLKEYGINLTAYKSKQLLRRMESFVTRTGAINEDDFIKKLKDDNSLYNKFRDHLTINVSEFFRNKDMFSDLENIIKNDLNPDKKTLKIWSAACSNGSEPYTLAIIMEKLSPGRKHNILATDIDNTILATAKAGNYTKNDIKNVDSAYINKYFTQNGEAFSIKDEIKNKVTFKKHDLILDRYDSDFDLIVCRNVVIYFTPEAKNQVYRKFHDAMKPGALLFVGATESIYNYRELGFEKASTFIYRKAGGN